MFKNLATVNVSGTLNGHGSYNQLTWVRWRFPQVEGPSVWVDEDPNIFGSISRAPCFWKVPDKVLARVHRKSSQYIRGWAQAALWLLYYSELHQAAG